MTSSPTKQDVQNVRIETDNSNGWIDIYDFFGTKIKKLKFMNALGFVEFEIPQGEYYVYIRGNESVIYSQLKIDNEFNYDIKRLMLS